MPYSFTTDLTQENLISCKQIKLPLIFTPIWDNNETVEYDTLIIDLSNTPAFLRLKEVDQSGPSSYYGKLKFFEIYDHYGPAPFFSRYDHSLGVFWLIKYKANGDLIEQAAALYHDISHTAFSHVGDHMRALLENLNDPMSTQKCYQDDIHLDFLKRHNIDSVISSYGIELEDLNPAKYTALKGGPNELSADRIEYFVHTAVIFKVITKKEASHIINDVAYNNGIWFFTDQSLALKFADISIIFTKEMYTTPSNFVSYQYFSKILLRAIELKLFTLDDFKYGTDNFILEKLEQTKDPVIKHRIEKLDDINKIFKVVGFNESEIHLQLKSRAVDPNIKIGENEYTKLSNLNTEFASRLDQLQKYCKIGYGIEYDKDELDKLSFLENQSINTCLDERFYFNLNLYGESSASDCDSYTNL